MKHIVLQIKLILSKYKMRQYLLHNLMKRICMLSIMRYDIRKDLLKSKYLLHKYLKSLMRNLLNNGDKFRYLSLRNSKKHNLLKSSL